MPGSADFVQRFVHALEAGGAAAWIKRALVALTIVVLALFYLLHEFRGLATSQAMDQAQIGRELMHGHGWATNFARPLAAGQLQAHGENVGEKIWGGPINAIYLTPISGSQNTLKDILKGDYRDWSTVILRSLDLQKLPLKWATLLGLENECVFFSDHDRQQINTGK